MLLLVFRKICTIICQCSWHAFLFVGLLSKIGSRLKSVISLSLSEYALFLDRFFNLSTLQWSQSTHHFIFVDYRFLVLFSMFFLTKILFSQFFSSPPLLLHSPHWNASPKKRRCEIFPTLTSNQKMSSISFIFPRRRSGLHNYIYFQCFFSSFRLPKHSSFCSMNLQKYFPDFNFDWFSWIRQ